MSEHACIFEALLDAADRVPDTGEGGEWHQRNDYAWHLRQDWYDCVERDDLVGAMDCVLDARDQLARWAERDGLTTEAAA